jgi:2-methylcitrate dehydratase
MERIRISENKSYTREFPEKLVTTIDVTTRGGQRLSETVSYPKGHAKNPMTDADIEGKFRDLSQAVMTRAACDALLAALWRVEDAHDVGSVLDLVRVTP